MPSTQPADAIAPHARRIRWLFAALLLCASVVNYIDRQTLSVLADTIQRVVGLTDTQYGRVVQAFLFTYMIMYVLSGRMVDRFGARRMQGIFLLAWSAANALTGFVTGFYSLVGCRALLGMAEPGNYTASLRVAGDWFDAKERAVAVGIYSMGGTIGAAIAVPLTAGLAIRYGWRSAFFVTGILGAVLAGIWLLVYRDSENGAPESRKAIERMPWRLVLRLRYLPELFIVRLLTDAVWYFFLFWIPKYMQDARGLSLRGLGATLWIVYVAADAGSLGGGLISSRLVGRSFGAVRSRLYVMVPAAACMLALVCVPRMASERAALAIISLLALCHMAWLTNCTTLTLDLFPAKLSGTVLGMIGTASAAGGLLSTGLIGRTIQNHGYGPVFLGLALLHPISAAILLYRLRPALEKKG